MLIAVDTGASKTLIARMTNDGKIAAKTRFPTPKNTNEYITLLQNGITEVAGGENPKAIVVALPGVIKDGIVISCPNLGWTNFDVRPPLMARFPGLLPLVENDANLAGLGETRLLHPTPRMSLYVTISTGIGTGFITNNEIDSNLHLSEGGHMLLEYDGALRYWETFAAGSAIRKAYGKFARDITSKRSWDQIADRISRGFLAIIPLVQPDIVIIGGSVGVYFERYAEQLEAILHEELPSYIPCPSFHQAKHPEEAVIYGCYFHAFTQPSHRTPKG